MELLRIRVAYPSDRIAEEPIALDANLSVRVCDCSSGDADRFLRQLQSHRIALPRAPLCISAGNCTNTNGRQRVIPPCCSAFNLTQDYFEAIAHLDLAGIEGQSQPTADATNDEPAKRVA